MQDKDDDHGDGGGRDDLRRNVLSTATLGIYSMCVILSLSSATLEEISPFFTCEN